MAITWKSPHYLRMNRLYFANAMLRKLGLPQPTPGCYPAHDGVKVAALNPAQAIIARSGGARACGGGSCSGGRRINIIAKGRPSGPFSRRVRRAKGTAA